MHFKNCVKSTLKREFLKPVRLAKLKEVGKLFHTRTVFSAFIFRRETRGNAFVIVEKLSERMGSALPLLKRLRAHYGHHCEPFTHQNTLDCRILHIQSQKFFTGGDNPGPQQKRPDA